MLALAAPAQAFRSTKQEHFTDPDYVGCQPSVVMISVMSDDFEVREVIEDGLSRDLSKRGVVVFAERDVFPPTR